MNIFSYIAYRLSKKDVAAPAPREDMTVVSYNIRYFK